MSHMSTGPPLHHHNNYERWDAIPGIETNTEFDARARGIPIEGQHNASSEPGSQTSRKSSVSTWLPYTLRWPFLVTTASVSLLFAITLIVLRWYSAKNSGLGRDDESPGLLLGWRYTPTLIAVFFTQAIVMMTDEIKRTEPFTRLAHGGPIDAESTFLYMPKAWWKVVFQPFLGCFKKRKRTDRASLVLFTSALATGVCLLLVSTLSSSLLVTEHVRLRSTVPLKRYVLDQNGKIPLVPGRNTYFDTASGFLYNASTSMWVSDSHVVLPFGPQGPRGSSDFLTEGGVWEAETKVFQMESTCVPMSLTEYNAANMSYLFEWDSNTPVNFHSENSSAVRYPPRNMTVNETLPGFTLHSEDGCDIQLHTYNRSVKNSHRVIEEGGLFWTNISASYVSWSQVLKEQGNKPFFTYKKWMPPRAGIMMEFSDSCLGRNLIFASTPWKPTGYNVDWNGFRVRAEICTPMYYEATVLVTASASSGSRKIGFDEGDVKKRRVQVGDDVIDRNYLEMLTFQGQKPDYLNRSLALLGKYTYDGLTETLGASYAFNTTSMLNDASFARNAARLRARFFGELVLSSITEQQPEVMQDTTGQKTVLQKRILVISEVAITLSALCFALACYLAYMSWRVSTTRRPLNLSVDPATIFGLATYLRANPSVARLWHPLRVGSSQSQEFIESRNDLEPEIIVDEHGAKAEKLIVTRAKTIAHRRDWRPPALHFRSLSALLFSIVAVAVTILILRHFAEKQQLYRTAFVYQVDLGVLNARLAPYSVIATLIAVGISLSWEAIDKHIRILQPYLAMTQKPARAKNGVTLSYQSSYWAWAAGKAGFNKHWLLLLVATGTTLCQVLIISMAAIFERDLGVVTQVVDIDQSYATRREPLTYAMSSAQTDADVLQPTMLHSTSDWLYSALDQILLQTPPPAWTRDGWAFAPIALGSLPNMTIRANKGNTKPDKDEPTLLSSSANASFVTTALRARLQCESIPTTDPSWFPRNAVNDLNSSYPNTARRLNSTGYLLPKIIFNNTSYNTSISANQARVFCCHNETDAVGRSAVAYWSHTNPEQFFQPDIVSQQSYIWNGRGPSHWPGNFTIKWMVGPTVKSKMTIYTDSAPGDYNVMQFTEVPSMQFLNCKPVIEQSNAKITVARSSGEVLNYRLLDAPQPQNDAWTAHFQNGRVGSDGSLSNYTYIRPNITAPGPLPVENYTAGISYGTYFMTQLVLSAAFQPFKVYIGYPEPVQFENLDDQRFNIRDPTRGLNVDFMSYSNYILANQDALALLDANTLLNHSQFTFQTFFQHFASQTKWTDGQFMALQEMGKDDKTEKIQTTVSQRIEVLKMISSATWLTVVILVLLMIILTTLMISLKVFYPPTTLQSNIECLADAMAMIAGSDELLERVQRYEMEELKRSELETRLGWFRDRRGHVRWGVEFTDALEIEWLEKPTK